MLAETLSVEEMLYGKEAMAGKLTSDGIPWKPIFDQPGWYIIEAVGYQPAPTYDGTTGLYTMSSFVVCATRRAGGPYGGREEALEAKKSFKDSVDNGRIYYFGFPRSLAADPVKDGA